MRIETLDLKEMLGHPAFIKVHVYTAAKILLGINGPYNAPPVHTAKGRKMLIKVLKTIRDLLLMCIVTLGTGALVLITAILMEMFFQMTGGV